MHFRLAALEDIAACVALRGQTRENRGIGRRLLNLAVLNLAVRQLADAGHRHLFLGCAADPSTCSHGFYRHLGCVSTGSFDMAGDEVLELLSP